MAKTKTTKFDVSEHLRTFEEMAAYLEACIEEANGYAAFIAKALGDIAPYKGPTERSVGSAKKGTRLPVNSAKGK